MHQQSLSTEVACRATVATLERKITELAAHISAAEYQFLSLIAEFDSLHGWSGVGIKSCAHWLNWKCGIGLGAAREKVRVATALIELPKISEAFRSGRISYSKVRAMTRVATPANEKALLSVANHGTASHVERLVQSYRKVNRLEALALDNERHARRSLSWTRDESGCYIIKARLSPEQGARITRVINRVVNSDLVNIDGEEKSVPAGTSFGKRRVDALERIVESYADENSADSVDSKATLHIHTDITTLRADWAGSKSTLEEGGKLSAEATRRLACDCGVVHWLDKNDSKKNPLNVGRRTRSISSAMRRALIRRDHGCRFPGCTSTHFVDAHHVKHWADGGETSLDNLLLLCRAHHRLVHEGGFGLTLKSPGEPVFTRPDGQEIAFGPDKRSRGNVFALFSQNQIKKIPIDSRTILPRWTGERMDYKVALDVLVGLRSKSIYKT